MRVVVLTGGVGGAKLVLGLCNVVPPEEVTAIVNTGDDFRHLGLWISPDLDTLIYTLAGLSNEAQGWGRAGETWTFMETLKSLGGASWFQLGDADLALHVERTRRMGEGESLSSIMADVAARWGVKAEIVPMCDAPVATWVDTDEGEIAFQRYFVERRCAPRLRGVRFIGAQSVAPTALGLKRIAEADAILIAPSNPFLSVDPILAVPGMRDALRGAKAPVVAVSPLVGGDAVKGPTRKIMDELGLEATPRAIAAHYEGLIDALLIDERDKLAPPPDVRCAYADTLMRSPADRARVAEAALALAAQV